MDSFSLRNPSSRSDASSGGVDGQFSRGDPDSGDPAVADAGEITRVAAGDDVHIIGTEAETGEGPFDVVGPVDRQIYPAGAAVLVRVLFDRLAGRGVTDDRQQFVQVIRQHLEKERLVAIMELPEIKAPGQVVRQRPQLGRRSFRLLTQSQYP